MQDLALYYMFMPELAKTLLALTAFFLPFVLAAYVWQPRYRLMRASFVILLSISLLGLTLALTLHTLWIGSSEFFETRYALIKLATTLTVLPLIGATWGHIGAARARDAFGSTKFAYFILIPIAQLWLVFKPGRDKTALDRRYDLPFLAGWTGGLTATLSLFVFASINHVLMQVVAQQNAGFGASRPYAAAPSQPRPPKPQAAPAPKPRPVAAAPNTATLAAELRRIARAVNTPLKISSEAELTAVFAVSDTLEYQYNITSAQFTLSAERRSRITSENCRTPETRVLLNKGALVYHRFFRDTGEPLGTVTVEARHCTS